MKKTTILIPSDIEGQGDFKQYLQQELNVCRKWFDRPAYYGTIAQVNNGHLDENEKEDIQCNS